MELVVMVREISSQLCKTGGRIIVLYVLLVGCRTRVS